jgi:hypothetical protein
VEVVLSPNSLSFGDVHTGATATQTVTLTNNSPSVVTITGISVPTGFSQQSACGATLGAGMSCLIDVTFAPTLAGSVSGVLSVSDDAVGSPHTILVSGRGIAGNVSLSLSSLLFGADLVGTTSSARVVTLSNNGTGLLTISSIATTEEFSIVPGPNSCLPGFKPDGRRELRCRVAFSPTVAGDRNGSLTIQSDASNNPSIVSLSGIGLDSLLEPVIASLSPNARAIGSIGITLTVNGTGFSSLSIIRWAGVDRPTTYINNNSLRTTLASSDFVTMGTVPVSVFNPPQVVGHQTALNSRYTALPPSLQKTSSTIVLEA